jgi:uncharacterized protein (TIGR03083 family)
MGSRPLRQYYDGVSIVVDDDLSLVDPWIEHRRRLVAALSDLTDEQWASTTRCTSWDARGVVSHLVTVDAFWVSSLRGALARAEPTTFIRGFDPSTGTDAFVDPMLELPTEAIFEMFVDGTDAFVATVDAFDGDDWDALGEAPFGHLPARLLLAHAHWDSWLHERDILQPLGLAAAVEPGDLLNATWYTLVVGGMQGGLLDDTDPVGPGPEAPIDVTLRFADLPEAALHVTIDGGVSIMRTDPTTGVAAGAALDLVESLAGRARPADLDVLPSDLAAQLGRAALIL